MAAFNVVVTTDQGLALVADLLAGEQLVFTKLVTGSGVYTDEDLERTKMQKATCLREVQQEFGFSNVSKVTDTCVLLKTLISNKDLEKGYRITEIGVYAKKQDEEGDGVLYSISVAKEADYIPHYNGFVAVEITQEYYITVADTAEVSIQTGSGASVLVEDFEKFKEEIKRYIDQWMDNLQKQIGDLSQLKTEKKCCLVDAVNEIVDVIKPLTEYSYMTSQDVQDIIAGIYENDLDWLGMLDAMTGRDVKAIINGTYVPEQEDEGFEIDGNGVMSHEDIIAIINGTYVPEQENLNEEEVTE